MVQTLQPAALAIEVLFPAISTILVALRIWVRTSMKQFAWDDGLILIAWALAVAYAGVVCRWIQIMWLGYHIWDVPELSMETNIFATKLNMIQQLLYNPILCIVKASIILFLLRLGDRRKGIRWSLLALFWFNLGHMVAVFVAALMQCLPIHMYWDHYRTDQVVNGAIFNPNYTCFDAETFSLTTAGLAILTDVLILMVPVAIMWNLQLDTRKKIGVGIVMSLGWVVTAVSIVRLKLFYDFFEVTTKDPTYSLATTLSGIEVNVAIFTACGPAMKALIMRFAPRFFGTQGGTQPSASAYYSAGHFELSRQTPTTRSTQHPHGAVAVRDDDGDSQDAIIINDSLGAAKGGIGVEREVEQTYAPSGGHGLSRNSYGWQGSHQATIIGSAKP